LAEKKDELTIGGCNLFGRGSDTNIPRFKIVVAPETNLYPKAA
jgi:hypothetical protein